MHIKTREALLSAPGLHPRASGFLLSTPWPAATCWCPGDPHGELTPQLQRIHPPAAPLQPHPARGARRDHSPLHPIPGPTQGQLSPCGPPDELAERGGRQAGTQQQCFPLGGAWSSWHLHSALSFPGTPVIPTMAIRTLRLWEACWGPGISETGFQRQPQFTLCTKRSECAPQPRRRLGGRRYACILTGNGYLAGPRNQGQSHRTRRRGRPRPDHGAFNSRLNCCSLWGSGAVTLLEQAGPKRLHLP